LPPPRPQAPRRAPRPCVPPLGGKTARGKQQSWPIDREDGVALRGVETLRVGYLARIVDERLPKLCVREQASQKRLKSRGVHARSLAAAVAASRARGLSPALPARAAVDP
jgi:hypothetical protein